MSTRRRLLEVITNLNEAHHLLSKILEEDEGDLSQHLGHIEIIQDMANEVAELSLDERFERDERNDEGEDDHE